jgi:hypothetical protein
VNERPALSGTGYLFEISFVELVVHQELVESRVPVLDEQGVVPPCDPV